MGNWPGLNGGSAVADHTAVAVTFTFLRVLLFIFCAETAVRYALWWRVVYREEDTRLMRDLMLGIAVIQAAFLLITTSALLFTWAPRSGPGVPVLLIGDCMLVVGTFLHLRPAWRMNEIMNRTIPIRVTVKVVASILIAVILVELDLQ